MVFALKTQILLSNSHECRSVKVKIKTFLYVEKDKNVGLLRSYIKSPYRRKYKKYL